MHPITQFSIVLLLAAIVGGGYVALTQGLPERETRTEAQQATDAFREYERAIGGAFCEKVREEVAAGKTTVIPGGRAERCF